MCRFPPRKYQYNKFDQIQITFLHIFSWPRHYKNSLNKKTSSGIQWCLQINPFTYCNVNLFHTLWRQNKILSVQILSIKNLFPIITIFWLFPFNGMPKWSLNSLFFSFLNAKNKNILSSLESFADILTFIDDYVQFSILWSHKWGKKMTCLCPTSRWSGSYRHALQKRERTMIDDLRWFLQNIFIQRTLRVSFTKKSLKGF